MANFDLVNLALKATCPGNEIILDDKGLPSVMVRVPKLKNSDLYAGGDSSTHKAWIVNGQEVPEIYISKYQNVIHNGRAYSLPGEDPANSLTWDTARAACESKGPGWHMMTKPEYAAIALWCKKNGFMPWGNNNYGLDSRESLVQAIPANYDSDGRTNRVLTGTGPVKWSHNNAIDGIWDLNGNVSEWTGGIRTVYGEIQVQPDNNGANSINPQDAAATTWRAIDATTGEFIVPNELGTTPNSVKVDAVSGVTYSTNITTQSESFSAIISDLKADASISEAAKEVLIEYGLFPDDAVFDYEGDRLYFNNIASERLFYSGGFYAYTTTAGVFYAYGSVSSRAYAGAYIGFRSAYVKL
jgi:sulfatase modifying factor 1